MKNETYEEFVEKFKPKKTTDDCYTPPEIYQVIKDWACREYGIKEENIVRPFWPGGDYENFDYPEGCVVLDNPPFSILSKICAFYLEREIPFFLFAPSLTLFSRKNTFPQTNHIVCDCCIEYENGARVKTSFITSFDCHIAVQTCPELTRLVNDTVNRLHKEKTKDLPKYEYPSHVCTAAMMQKYSKYGIDFKIRHAECFRVRTLDMQREHKKDIYGGGLLLSEKAAAEKAAAERAAEERAAEEKTAATVWELSEKERRIVAGLSQ